MERVIGFVLLVSAVLLGSVGVLRFREAHAAWQFDTLVILVSLPVALALLDVCRGRQRIVKGVQTIAVSAVTIVGAIWTHSNLHASWAVATAAALALFFILSGIFWRHSTMGELALRRASAALGSDPPDPSEALRALKQAEGELGTDASKAQRAVFDYLSAAAHARLGNLTRASAHASEAQALYQSLGQAAGVNSVTTLARQLNLKITPLPPGGSYAANKGRYSIALAISGVLTVAAALALYRMWTPPSEVPAIELLAGIGIALGVWFLALPWFVIKQRAAGFGLVIFSIALTGALASLAAEAIRNGRLGTAALGPGLETYVKVFREWLTSTPLWVPLTALGLFSILALFSLVVGKEATGKALARAESELTAERWDRAIAVLGSVNIGRERNPAVKGKVLFWLAFAQRMSGGQVRAQELLEHLLAFSPEHRDGLYLAGYIALETGDLDRAESLWNRLCAIDPAHSPVTGDACRSAAYCLSATLYRKAVTLKDQPDAEADMLSRISQIGAMDKSLAKTLVGAHRRRGVELLRRQQWQSAGSEFETAGLKFASLDKADSEHRDTRKLQVVCEGGRGLAQLKTENCTGACEAFQHARELIADMIADDRVFGGEDDLLAQFLRAAQRKRSDADSADPAFARDLSFLAGVAQLKALRLQLGQHGKPDWNSALAVAQRSFEESLEASPAFPEGTATLGLLYCYVGTPGDRVKGLELLKRVQERIGGKFVSETIKRQEIAEKSRSEARDAYFQVFQEYLRSSSIPLTERQRMHDEMIGRMKRVGQDKEFIGRGGLDMDADREQEPTLKEYVARAAMLREKLLKLGPQVSVPLDDELQKLVQELGAKTQELQDHARSVLDTQREIMKKAHALLFN